MSIGQSSTSISLGDGRRNPAILLDFDGVIHYYEKCEGGIPRGAAIHGIQEAVQLITNGLGIKPDIFSTRPAPAIHKWLVEKRLRNKFGRIIDEKPYYLAFFDDRAYNVRPNESFGLYDSIMQFAKTPIAQKLVARHLA